MVTLTDGDVMGLLGVYGYVFTVVSLTWAVKSRIKNPRKTVHIATGGIVFFWWTFDSAAVMAGLAALPFIPILLLATPKSPIAWLRRSPLGARSSEGHPYGLVMYAVSWTVIAYFLFEDLFAASVAIAAMSFGDGMGEVVGHRFGKLRFMENRTLEGSSAVLVASTVSVIVLGWFYFVLIGYQGGTEPYNLPLFALSVGSFVTCLEAVTPGNVDNLVIPLVVGGYLHMLGV